MIEPAAFGVPCCFGPNTANFRVTVEQLLLRQAARQVATREELQVQLSEWIKSPDQAAMVGDRAKAFIQEQQGAVDRTWMGLSKHLPGVHRPLYHRKIAIPA
ncbi:MAG: hypothetical protein QM753_21100 [Thermomicrobiales bacterium]